MKKPVLIAAMMFVALGGCAHGAAPTCVERPGDRGEIERTVHALYDAMRADDLDAFKTVTTADFYAFDGGARYAGTALAEELRDAHRSGVRIVWSLGPMDIEQRCSAAWAAWENVGSVASDGKADPVKWLESAVLVRDGPAWKIDFLHSHRAKKK